MKVGIEQFRVLEKLAQHQVRIYPDACDHGLVIVDSTRRLPQLNGKNFDFLQRDISIYDLVKEQVAELKEQGFYFETESWGDLQKSGGKTIKFNFAWENSERNPKLVQGTQVEIGYHVDNKGSKQLKFYSIDLRRWEGEPRKWLRGEA